MYHFQIHNEKTGETIIDVHTSAVIYSCLNEERTGAYSGSHITKTTSFDVAGVLHGAKSACDKLLHSNPELKPLLSAIEIMLTYEKDEAAPEEAAAPEE